jgi:hypothetical protein
MPVRRPELLPRITAGPSLEISEQLHASSVLQLLTGDTYVIDEEASNDRVGGELAPSIFPVPKQLEPRAICGDQLDEAFRVVIAELQAEHI